MRPLRHLPNSFPAQSFLDIPREVTCNTLPFSHCLITNWVYFKIIITNWAISLSLAFVIASLTQGAEPYAWASFSVITLLVLAVSYIIIFVNVQNNPHSRHHGTVHKERKLSITLLIVTGVSLLTILPMAILNSLPEAVKQKRMVPWVKR